MMGPGWWLKLQISIDHQTHLMATYEPELHGRWQIPLLRVSTGTGGENVRSLAFSVGLRASSPLPWRPLDRRPGSDRE